MIPPPAIDEAIGIQLYSTSVAGIGGRIRQSRDQFAVEEILDPALEVAPSADKERHPYPLYLLRKDGIDSVHALKEVQTSAGLKMKVVGLKDARAVTKQFASMTTRRQDPKDKVVTRHCTLDLVGFTSRPISKRSLVANRFTIIVVCDLLDEVEKSLRELQQLCVDSGDDDDAPALANFYGYQRFGSARPVTHLVGREIVKRNFDKAVEIFLTYAGEYEGKEAREIRGMCKDSSRFPDLLRAMPLQMDLERTLIAEMIRSGNPIRAIRKLPVTIRRLFVNAYQSYIFNRSLSMAIKEGVRIATAEEGDICFSHDGDGIKVTGMGRFEEAAGSTKTKTKKRMQLPAIPLAGYAFRDSKSRFGRIVSKVMTEEESVSGKEFYVKDLQEVSAEGGFRQAPLVCRDFSWSTDGDSGSLQLSFLLPKGSYATVLLRELMKPANPIAAGF